MFLHEDDNAVVYGDGSICALVALAQVPAAEPMSATVARPPLIATAPRSPFHRSNPSDSGAQRLEVSHLGLN